MAAEDPTFRIAAVSGQNVAELAQIVVDANGAAHVRGLPLDTHDATTLHRQLRNLLAATFPDHELAPADGKSPFWAVEDHGGTTFSINSSFAPPHLDGVTVSPPIEIVGLCGVLEAPCGGETYVVDVQEVLAELAATPEGRRAAHVLRTHPVPHERSSVFGPRRIVCLPILTDDYCRWREDLFAFSKQPDLDSPALRSAIDQFSATLMRARRLPVRIAPGEVLVWNQRRLLHGRYSFSGPRKLIRFWLSRVRDRQICPDV